MLCAFQIVGVAQLLFESGDFLVSTSGGAVTI